MDGCLLHLVEYKIEYKKMYTLILNIALMNLVSSQSKGLKTDFFFLYTFKL